MYRVTWHNGNVKFFEFDKVTEHESCWRCEKTKGSYVYENEMTSTFWKEYVKTIEKVECNGNW